MNSTPVGDGLVEVASFVYPHDAKFARAQLEAEEIPCFLDNERTLDIDWFLATMMGGYRLLVPTSFVDRARDFGVARIGRRPGSAGRPRAALPRTLTDSQWVAPGCRTDRVKARLKCKGAGKTPADSIRKL